MKKKPHRLKPRAPITTAQEFEEALRAFPCQAARRLRDRDWAWLRPEPQVQVQANEESDTPAQFE